MFQSHFLVKRIMPLVLLFLFVECSSIKRDNLHLQKPIAVKQLHQDIEFTRRKFQRLHPKLDYYISAEKLNFKFDSLKNSIKTTLIPLAFYKKLSPVVAAIRQGHCYVIAPEKQYTKKETKSLTKKGVGPFSQFDFTYYDDKLYVVKNKSNNKKIIPGTEVQSVNGIKPPELLSEYDNYYSSDGFNTSFKKEAAANRFVRYFTIENGIKDSLLYVFKYNDSIKNITIKRVKSDSLNQKTKKASHKKVIVDRDKQRMINKKKRINGFDKSANTFIRELKYVSKDSSIALLKIRSFTKGHFKQFYRQTFAEIKKQNCKTLIIDLRNNGGGRLSEIIYLYSYLADSTYTFLQKSEVVSRGSLIEGAYFNKGNFAVKMTKTLFSPIAYGYLLLTVRTDKNGKKYISTATNPQKPKPNAFKHKLYVMINGGSFSASSIISSNLKGSKRALFVGQETGGDFNGTVAGFMPIFELPNSKLKVRIGTIHFAPFYQNQLHGRGVFPDIEIQPNVEDRIKDNDPELNWIVKQNTK